MPLPLALFPDKKSCYSNWFSPVLDVISLLLSQFSLVFSFQKVLFICVLVFISLVYPVWVSFSFLTLRFLSFAKYVAFSAIVSLNTFFQSLSTLSLFLFLTHYSMLNFLLKSYMSTGPNIYLFIIYSPFSDWVISILFQFTDSSLCCFYSAVELICWVLKFWLLYFSI